MVAAEMPSNASLAELLSARARRTPPDRLVVDVVGGLAVAITAAWARPGTWVVWTAAGACLAMYGLWAFAEVSLLPRAWPEKVAHESMWQAVRGTAAVLGVGAFVVLLLAALGVALGPLTS